MHGSCTPELGLATLSGDSEMFCPSSPLSLQGQDVAMKNIIPESFFVTDEDLRGRNVLLV